MKVKMRETLFMGLAAGLLWTVPAMEGQAAEGGRDVPHYDIREAGGVWDGTNYILPDGTVVKDAFFCDGTYTYYRMMDGTPMKDRLSYHPDGDHVIYLDAEGHEVFSDFAHVKQSIAGDPVDDLCFFDVYGYMYVDMLTYDKEGVYLYYANPYGVMERNGWFEFSSKYQGGYGYANEDGTLMTDQYTYDWNGNLVYMEADGHMRGSRNQGGDDGTSQDPQDPQIPVDDTFEAYYSLYWKITDEGKLIVTGSTDGLPWGQVVYSGELYDEFGYWNWRYVPWQRSCSEITSAYVDFTGGGHLAGLFQNYENLKEVDFSHFDTSQMTDMSQMFLGCKSLESLELSTFDTSNMTVMTNMFYDCSSLKKLDLSTFDTSNVTSLYGMFDNCSSLKSLNLRGFDTSNVTKMTDMFRGCSSLESLDLSSFDTGKVTNMQSMFAGCTNLKEILVGEGWKPSEDAGMFGNDLNPCGVDHVTVVSGE